MTFELDLLKMILREQQRTNELLAQLLNDKKPVPTVSTAMKPRTTRRAKAK